MSPTQRGAYETTNAELTTNTSSAAPLKPFSTRAFLVLFRNHFVGYVNVTIVSSTFIP